MKRKNRVACEEARLINAAGDRPIDLLDSEKLDRHLENIFLFKLGLFNSFGVDFRELTHVHSESHGRAVLFNYLSEVLPLLEVQARRLPKPRYDVYVKLADMAVSSFWEIYYRFQPLLRRFADRQGVEIDDLGNVLGRAILLYDKQLGFKFFSYLEKTLRESVKNLRGQKYAEAYHLPLSAGRLVSQLLWRIDQETLRLQRRLSPDESDHLVVNFLTKNSAKFSESTMRMVARAVRSQMPIMSIDAEVVGSVLPSSGNNPADVIEAHDEYEHTLRRIHDAIARAGFDDREQAMVLERLNLSYDENLHGRIASELTSGSLRNRKSQLLVRFMAAMHAPEAPLFGKFLMADPAASRPILLRAIGDLAAARSTTTATIIQSVLNCMSLSDAIYRLSINERGRLDQFLAGSADADAKTVSITGHLFNKLKAGLIDQERQGFPALK